MLFIFFLSSQVAGLRTKDASTGTESTTSLAEERPAARPLRENRASSDRQSSRRSTLTLRRLRLIAVAPAVIPMARALYGNKLASPNVPKLAEEVNTYIITHQPPPPHNCVVCIFNIYTTFLLRPWNNVCRIYFITCINGLCCGDWQVYNKRWSFASETEIKCPWPITVAKKRTDHLRRLFDAVPNLVQPSEYSLRISYNK